VKLDFVNWRCGPLRGHREFPKRFSIDLGDLVEGNTLAIEVGSPKPRGVQFEESCHRTTPPKLDKECWEFLINQLTKSVPPRVPPKFPQDGLGVPVSLVLAMRSCYNRVGC